MRPDDVAICVPCHSAWEIGFGRDLVELFRANAGLPSLHVASGPLLPQVRENLAAAAIEGGAGAILWIDSDMRFPPDTLERLSQWGWPICGVNATTRSAPARWTATGLDGRRISSRGREGCEVVQSCGMGVLFHETALLHELEPPWFDTRWDGNTYLGTDLVFLERVKASGHVIKIDHGLSQEIGHIGRYEFGPADA